MRVRTIVLLLLIIAVGVAVQLATVRTAAVAAPSVSDTPWGSPTV
jgi:hypothetical protein